MAEEDTVADEDDGIMSEDAAKEKEGPHALNVTSRQLRYYSLGLPTQNTQSRSTSVYNPLCYTYFQNSVQETWDYG